MFADDSQRKMINARFALLTFHRDHSIDTLHISSTITDATMEIAEDVVRSQGACWKPTAYRNGFQQECPMRRPQSGSGQALRQVRVRLDSIHLASIQPKADARPRRGQQGARSHHSKSPWTCYSCGDASHADRSLGLTTLEVQSSVLWPCPSSSGPNTGAIASHER